MPLVSYPSSKTGRTMIYLTGQLLFFLLVSAFVGFVIGWLLRGAMLPLSMFNDSDASYLPEQKISGTAAGSIVNQGYQPLHSYTSQVDDTL